MFRRRLGKRVDRTERKKARPVLFPDEGPCSIPEAYKTLSRPAFAIWIRMSVAERDELRAGRCKMVESLGYSRRQGYELFRELERKGFVRFLPGSSPWRKSVIVIVRKPLLEAGHGFTRFQRSLSDFSDHDTNFEKCYKKISDRGQSSSESWQRNSPDAHSPQASFSQLPVGVKQLPKFVRQLPISSDTYLGLWIKTYRTV